MTIQTRAGSESCTCSSRPERPTPTRRSGAGPIAQRAVEERAGELADSRGVVGADRQRGRTGPDREVRIANLRRDGARDLAAAAKMLCQLHRDMRRSSSWSRSGSEMSRANVSSSEIEMRSVETSSGRGSMPARPVAQLAADLAPQDLPQVVVGDRGDVADRVDPEPDEALLCPRPDPRQDPDRERREERRFATRPDDRQPARLAAVGRHLRDHLRGRHPERARELGAGPHDRLDRLCDRARVVERRRDLAEVEVALVDPRLLDRRHDFADRRPDLTRVVAVERVPWADEYGVRDSGGAPPRPTSRSGSRSPGPRSCTVATTPRPWGSPPTISGTRRNDGSSSSSTAAKNASRSRCATIMRGG